MSPPCPVPWERPSRTCPGSEALRLPPGLGMGVTFLPSSQALLVCLSRRGPSSVGEDAAERVHLAGREHSSAVPGVTAT